MNNPIKLEENNENEKKEDEKENPKQEIKRLRTDSVLDTKPEVKNDRKNRLQARLMKAKQMNQKKEEEEKKEKEIYKQSNSIKLRASLYESKFNKKDEQK